MKEILNLKDDTIICGDDNVKMTASDKYVEWQIKKDKFLIKVVVGATCGIGYLLIKIVIETKQVFGL